MRKHEKDFYENSIIISIKWEYEQLNGDAMVGIHLKQRLGASESKGEVSFPVL